MKYKSFGKYSGQTVGIHNKKTYIRGYNDKGEKAVISFKPCEVDSLIIALLELRKRSYQ